MGFEEMATDKFVESGFWNFDALFVPQQHPARDMQDTFFLSDPKYGAKPGPQDAEDSRDYEQYWKNVQEVHQTGKFGSIGYRYPWSEDECLKLVVRICRRALLALEMAFAFCRAPKALSETDTEM